ncbi:MAG TPA: c-type cytochrome [Gemmatimonadales bacterium]
MVASEAASADTITPAMLALGEQVFQGKKGGALCTTCHGKDAKGVKGLGPDLTDGVWLHGDGGVEFLKTIIRSGVMQPKQGGGVMPPYGGTPLPPDRLEAVAAYVYSLSHQRTS